MEENTAPQFHTGRKYSLQTNWGEEETGHVEETTGTGANTNDDHSRIVVREEDDKHISRDSKNGVEDKFVSTVDANGTRTDDVSSKYEDDDCGGGGETSNNDDDCGDERCNETRIDITDVRISKCDDDHQPGDDEGSGGDKCVIEGTECTTHGCQVKTFKLTSQKWTWKDRQKKFGNISVKRNVKICALRNSGRVIPKNVPEQNFSTGPGDQNCVETNLGAN